MSFTSLEEYFYARQLKANEFNELIKIDSKDRDYIRVEERRLQHICDLLGIDFKLFKCKDTDRYYINTDVADLFDYILNYFMLKHQKEVKQKRFEDISTEHLVELRVRLLSALYSIGLDGKAVQKEMETYERFTDCPASYDNLDISELTQEAIDYWKDFYSSDLTRSEWDRFAQEVQNNYWDIWRPRFINFTLNLLKSFFTDNGKEFQDKDPGVDFPSTQK